MKEMVLLSLSILLPTLTGLLFLNKNTKIFSFVICLVIGSFISITPTFISNPFVLNILMNIYVLIEYVLLLIQFRMWGIFQNKYIFYFLILGGSLIWIYTGVYVLEIGNRNTYFRAFYSFVIVLCSIELINRVAFERINLMRDYRFIICIGFIIFYFYNIIIESFCLTKLNFSSQFYINIFNIKSYLNFFINLLYFFALLCIPITMKQKSIM